MKSKKVKNTQDEVDQDVAIEYLKKQIISVKQLIAKLRKRH